MNAEPKNKSQARPSGRKYDTVDDFVASEGVPREIRDRVSLLKNQTKITLQLALLRQNGGLTQEEMAAHLNVTQSAISKLEAGTDDQLRLAEIAHYAKATGERICLGFGKPLNHMEAVKLHAVSIKRHLEALAKLANQQEELGIEIKAFFGEAFFNMLDILSACADKLPSGPDFDVTVEISNRQCPRGITETATKKETVAA
jgi:transcriptional regulator with XRE-family HTH domain